MADEIFDARRKKLEDRLLCAAMDLRDHMGADSFLLKVPEVDVYVAVGSEKGIKRVIED